MATLFEPATLADGADLAVPGWISAMTADCEFAERDLAQPALRAALGAGSESREPHDGDKFEAGRQAGLAEACAQNEADFEARGRLASQISALDEAALLALRERLAELVEHLCAEVLGEAACDPANLRRRCEVAASRLQLPLDQIRLHLHPLDAAMLEPGFLDAWNFVEDPDCARGSIRLESRDSIVRDGPKDWYRAIAEALRA